MQTDAGVVKLTLHRLHTPLASHFHFTSHSLNLVLAHSCKLNVIRNMIDRLTEACLFFNYSPKREAILKNVIETECPDGVAVAFSVISLSFSCTSLHTTHTGLSLYAIEKYFNCQSSLNNRDSDSQRMDSFFVEIRPL